MHVQSVQNTVFHCQICKFVGFSLPSSSWLLKLPSEDVKHTTTLREKILYQKRLYAPIIPLSALGPGRVVGGLKSVIGAKCYRLLGTLTGNILFCTISKNSHKNISALQSAEKLEYSSLDLKSTILIKKGNLDDHENNDIPHAFNCLLFCALIY